MKWDKIEHRLKKSLDEERYRHTLGVAETAEKMAETFGEDTEKARLAGLLHDCAKCMSLDEMISIVGDRIDDPLIKASKALMHAAAGMYVAKEEYHIDDPDVLGAIRWHTTGRANMTNLEKIVYLADMIEPNRRYFPGLDALRRLSYSDLDKAMQLGLTMSLQHVGAQGKIVHPDTRAALQDYSDKPNKMMEES